MTTRKETTVTDSFEVEDSDGERYTIIEHKTFLITHLLNDQETRTETQTHYTTDQGNNINRLDDETFLLVVTGQVLRRITQN